MLLKAWNSKGEMPFCFPRSSIKFQGHTVQNITDIDPNWAFPDYRPVAAFKSLRFALFINYFLWLTKSCPWLVVLTEPKSKTGYYIGMYLILIFSAKSLIYFVHMDIRLDLIEKSLVTSMDLSCVNFIYVIQAFNSLMKFYLQFRFDGKISNAVMLLPNCEQ